MDKKQDGKFFSRVSAARQVLHDRAEEIVKEYLDIAAQAKAAGDYETAMRSLQWLLDHMPKDVDGGRLVDRSVDKDSEQKSLPTGPSIQIGIQLGGVNPKQKALPETSVEVIDAEKP